MKALYLWFEGYFKENQRKRISDLVPPASLEITVQLNAFKSKVPVHKMQILEMMRLEVR